MPYYHTAYHSEKRRKRGIAKMIVHQQERVRQRKRGAEREGEERKRKIKRDKRQRQNDEYLPNLPDPRKR